MQALQYNVYWRDQYGDQFRQRLSGISSKVHKPVRRHQSMGLQGRTISVTIRSCSSDVHVHKAQKQRLIFQAGYLHPAVLNSQFIFA